MLGLTRSCRRGSTAGLALSLMLGREKEQETLRAVIRELKVDRRGQMIAITGEAGYGKSCLVNALIMECNQQQVPVGLLVAEDGIEVG